MINVKPKPTLTTSGDTTLCDEDTTMISASGGDFYNWSPGSGLSDSTISSPQAFPENTTQYTVKSWDSLGCIAY
ncbi:MAG: hypothetical protein ABEH43_01335, partial [Flavobacteriales bacterium]